MHAGNDPAASMKKVAMSSSQNIADISDHRELIEKYLGNTYELQLGQAPLSSNQNASGATTQAKGDDQEVTSQGEQERSQGSNGDQSQVEKQGDDEMEAE